MKLLVVDGYIDEPTCLGVPPYLSTYVRYAAGAAFCAGVRDVEYLTIEQLRDFDLDIGGAGMKFDLAVIIAGNPVPGKYLGGKPIQKHELFDIAAKNPAVPIIAGGPIQSESYQSSLPNLKFIPGDIETFLYRHLNGGPQPGSSIRNLGDTGKFAAAGAFIAAKHPRFPDIIAEIETGRGCPRRSHCSFCVEGNFAVEFRQPEDVIREVKALRSAGVKHFRIGKQADLLAYGSELKIWKKGFPAPNPEWVRRLYEGIREAVPDLLTLHLDNINPGTIANYPDESRQILDTIVKYNTPGDVAALGMESADPEVIRRNFLKATPAEVKLAVEIINAAGSTRIEGIPKLLPGINLIRGLSGENRDTFRLNYEFLLDLVNSGLLVRRINIRQIKISKSTVISESHAVSAKEEKKLDAVFRNYREQIRRDIDIPMIKKIFTPGVILPELIVESRRGDWSIARSLGSYPIAVNLPKELPIHSKLTAFVVSYRERSLVGLPYPFSLSNASLLEIKQIPGYSTRAGEIVAGRLFDKKVLMDSPVYDYIKDCIR